MNKQPMTLEQRISDALQSDAAATSADVAALIEEAEAAIAKANKECAVEQTLALDPKAARQAIDDATFAANRLRTLVSKLEARYEEVLYQEQAAAWLSEHDTLRCERDALSEELRTVYPDIVSKIIDLFARMTANNEALSALHRARPPGVKQHLLSAELHARRLDSFSRDTPSLLTSVCLVDWDSGRQAWPPQKPAMASAVAAAMVAASSRRFSGDWWKESEQGAARQRAEQQRIADYYGRTTRGQEERENREARERFVASQRKKHGGSKTS